MIVTNNHKTCEINKKTNDFFILNKFYKSSDYIRKHLKVISVTIKSKTKITIIKYNYK